jgi:hypothetical protein
MNATRGALHFSWKKAAGTVVIPTTFAVQVCVQRTPAVSMSNDGPGVQVLESATGKVALRLG